MGLYRDYGKENEKLQELIGIIGFIGGYIGIMEKKMETLRQAQILKA